MSFSYFAKSKVDIAVIECGLGGRLDSTNIVNPLLSVITNIGLDHCHYLGNTLESIAIEKGGIIKHNVPVVIGEPLDSEEDVWGTIAQERNAPLFNAFALREDFQEGTINCCKRDKYLKILNLAEAILSETDFNNMDLKGEYQHKNLRTVATALSVFINLENISNLNNLRNRSKEICTDKLVQGIEKTAELMNLSGRWQKLKETPLIICDIGHNPHGLKSLISQLQTTFEAQLSKCSTAKFYFVFGIMKDKDLVQELPLLPLDAEYYIVNASSERAMKGEELYRIMKKAHFKAYLIEAKTETEALSDISQIPQPQSQIEATLNHLLQIAKNEDFIFIGGSSYVVAEVLALNKNKNLFGS